jgi:membrane-bound lytic murein transglycosylase D
VAAPPRVSDEVVVESAAEVEEIASEPIVSPFDIHHDAVDHYITLFLGNQRKRRTMEAALSRGHTLIPTIREILAEEDVPDEIVYLPIIESRFIVDARSQAGAAGLWQIMSRTGKGHGLRIERCLDERLDPALSTRAAAQYLRYLFHRFNDWHLALAAYNAGESRIARIINEYPNRDYWALARAGVLPRETRVFVPKFLAAARIGQSASVLGFAGDEKSQREPFLEVGVDRPIRLETVAELSGVELEVVRTANPALSCDRTPSGGYDVRLPAVAAETFAAAYAARADQILVASDETHRVRPGESPYSIARRYGVAVGALMKANGIANPRRLRIDTRLTIPKQRS